MLGYGSVNANLATNAFSILQAPSYRPQSPTYQSGNPLIENILNPPSQDPATSLNPYLPQGRRGNIQSAPNGGSRKDSRSSGQPSSALSKLLQDEEAVLRRRGNIARFGAGWIRPPGVHKTKQTMDDDEVEAREAQLLLEREQAANEAREAQERADAMGVAGVLPGQLSQAQRMMRPGDAAMDQEERDLDEMERDLDAELPEGSEPSEMEDDTTFYEGEDATRNLRPSRGEDDEDDTAEMEQQLDGAESMEGYEDRDLDDDVPEAGDYEHTDTEIESSELDDSRLSVLDHPISDLPRSFQSQARQQSPSFSGRVSTGSLRLDSSILLSSPTATRGQPQQPQQQTRRQAPPRR